MNPDSKWLVVYDNVEFFDLLMPYWPSASHGRAIITTRNYSLAFKPATTGLEITSWDTAQGSEFLLSLLKPNIGDDYASEEKAAYDLSSRLSGHTLGLLHMAGYIYQSSWTITEFMSAYLKDPKRVHDTELQDLWDFSFNSLNADSATFLGIASFLMPDNIPQSLFEFDMGKDLPEDISFCSDPFEYVAAP